jgi:anti-anti-sigma factor
VGKGMLKAWVEAGDSGPVIMLAGEADMTGAAQLDTLIAGQLAGGTGQLMIDISGLRFADSASMRTLALAARTLKERGGSLVLLDPQPSVARVMALLGVDQMVTIRTGPHRATAGDRHADGGSTQAPPGRTREACDEPAID